MKPKFIAVSMLMLFMASLSFAQYGSTPPPNNSSNASPQAPKMPRTIADVLNNRLRNLESDFVPAVDAMPEDKFSFAPTSGEFKGVRTFAQQATHVATANYQFASLMLGEKPPVDLGTDPENGPSTLKTKADILKFVRDSFVYAHKAMDQVTADNAVAPPLMSNGKPAGTRLGTAVLMVAHGFDHYGQMVEYLRMNGIIPPASRGQGQ